MPTLNDLTLLKPDGSGTPWDRIIPADAKVGDVVALIGGVSPALAKPAAPTIGAPTATSAQVSVPWVDGSDGGSAIMGHKVYRGTTAGAATLIGTLSTGSPYVDTGLSNGTTYYYQISAVNALGEGPRSAEVSATPQPTMQTGDVAVDTTATRNTSAGTITFTARRTGDTSGPKTWPWQIGPSTLGNGAGATAADFGGAYPTGTLTWPAGSTATRNITVTPLNGALPE